jgi:hypothetical protein
VRTRWARADRLALSRAMTGTYTYQYVLFMPDALGLEDTQQRPDRRVAGHRAG